MRDEKEERKKQARSNKQTRQSNTAYLRQSLFLRKNELPRVDMYHVCQTVAGVCGVWRGGGRGEGGGGGGVKGVLGGRSHMQWSRGVCQCREHMPEVSAAHHQNIGAL